MTKFGKRHPTFLTSLILLLISTLMSAMPVFSDDTSSSKTSNTETDKHGTGGALQSPPPSNTGPNNPPDIVITKITIPDTRWFGGASKEPKVCGACDCDMVSGHPDMASYPPTLYGTGVIGIDIDDGTSQLIKYMAAGRKKINLYLNGFLMDTDVPAVIKCDGKVRLTYNINPGAKSQKLWISLYRSNSTGDLWEPHSLDVGLGWDGGAAPTSSVARKEDNEGRVAITVEWRQWSALVLIVLLSALFIWMIFRTDILRDVQRPAFWRDAENLRNDMPKDPDAKEKWFTANLRAYNETEKQRYESMATEAVKGKLPADADIPATLIGLLLRNPVKSPPRATFSFARVQMGVWFCFAVLSSIYLWIIYNDLVPIDTTILGLIGLSVSTGVLSLVVDKSIPDKSIYFPSKGLFNDLIASAGGDDKAQIYRFQAVIVNLLLLSIGIVHIIQQLTFPTFDPSWLTFLGISGAAYLGGKQVVEAKP